MSTIPDIVRSARVWLAAAFADAVIDEPAQDAASGDWLFRIRASQPREVYELVIAEEAFEDHPTTEAIGHLLDRARVVKELRKRPARRLIVNQFGQLKEADSPSAH